MQKKMMIPRLLCSLVFVYFANCTDSDTNNSRGKRFFQNFQSYFAKSSTTERSASEPSRNVRVLTSEIKNLCATGNQNNCTETKFGRYEAPNPVHYLTPPTLEQDKILDNEYGAKYGAYNEHAENYGSAGNFQATVYNGTGAGDFFLGNEGDSFHLLPFSTGPESDLLKVRLKNMLCVKSSRNGRFSVEMVTSKSLPALPMIENGYVTENLPQCSVTTVDKTAFQVNLQEPDMIKCGVYYCDSDIETNLMCLTLRFPLINGIRTSNDVIMRIECHPQQQIFSQIKQFKVKPNFSTGRSLPVYGTISGGSPNQALRSQVGLYAMTEVGFTQLLANDDIVSVGQNLQLRSTIKSGDGWNFSRFGQILIQKLPSPIYGYGDGEGDSVVVIADDGCVNPLMKPICPLGPFNDPGNPLISILNLQMFEFNNMRDGDEMSMSVTIFGCIHYEDCYVSNQQCQKWPTLSRYKRFSPLPNMTDFTSEIKIKIRNNILENKYFQCNENGCYEAVMRRGEYYLIFLIFVSSNMILVSTYVLYHYCARFKWFRVYSHSMNNICYE